MIFLFFVLALVVPYLTGTALTMIMGERSSRGPIRWVMGVLSVLAFFFICLLTELKLHGSLEDLVRLFRIVTIATTGGSIPVVLFGIRKRRIKFQNFNLRILVWLVPAVALGVISVFLLGPDYTNDITIETVKTTMSTGTIYKYSSLLGVRMEAGLPIFNKLEIVPMLISCLCTEFGISPEMMIYFIAPFLSYSANIFIMWEISSFLVKDDSRNVFMIFHLLLLVAGTYLPTIAIPVTVGRPLLLQGYSGYAWAYGVLIPTMVLVLLQKRYLLAGLFIVPLAGLLRLDRIFYAGLNFFSSYESINAAGKLFVLYLASILWWVIKKKGKNPFHPATLLSGSSLISATLTDAYDCIGKKKSFVVWSGALIMACTAFLPFEDATFSFEKTDFDYSIVNTGAGETVLWAPEDVMEGARRADTSLCPLYGRDALSDMLPGTNYEPYSQDCLDLKDSMELINTYMDEYVESLIVPELETNRGLDEVDVIVLPVRTRSDRINTTLANRGFENMEERGEYLVLTRNE